MSFQPIDPATTKEGALIALIPLFGEEKSTPVKLDKKKSESLFTSFSVVQDTLSIKAASKLKIANIFGGTVNYNSKAFYFDAIAYTDEYDYQANDNDAIIRAIRWGIGIRIVLNITSIDSDVQLSLGAISAAIELGKAKARYEIKGLGIGLEGLNIVLEELSPLEDFSFETYYSIKNSVIPNLSKFIRKNKDNLEPQPIAVQLTESTDTDNLIISQSVLYAINSISKKMSLDDCLIHTPDGLLNDVISETYGKIVGEVNSKDKPSVDAIGRAKNWIKTVKV